ncbi:MAG: hypothetical protein Q8N36_03525 [bacterium]|nr:hypothetical protein [bacterium]
MQTDFCGRNGYVDVMGYDLANTASALLPIKNCLNAIRGTDIKVNYTRRLSFFFNLVYVGVALVRILYVVRS